MTISHSEKLDTKGSTKRMESGPVLNKTVSLQIDYSRTHF